MFILDFNPADQFRWLKNSNQVIKNVPTEKIVHDILKFNMSEEKKHWAEKYILENLIDEFLDRDDKDQYTGYIKKRLLEDGIRHQIILDFYVKSFLGYSIPRDLVCSSHTSPFSFVSDMFFERVRNSIAFASRTGGKTLNLAILNHLDMLFKDGCEIASAGSTLAQADRMYTYFVGFHNDNEYLAEELLKDPTKQKTFYRNKSMLEVITGSVKGLNCYSEDTEV
ncbi:MAG: hypothetical protein ACFFDN_23300, partial [Candidatus Hodarchaeota archaeon]